MKWFSLLVVLFSFFWTSPAFAVSFDNFDSYVAGDLPSQVDDSVWRMDDSDQVDYWLVSGAQAYSGTKSLKVNGASEIITPFSGEMDGVQTYEVKLYAQTSVSTIHEFGLGYENGSTTASDFTELYKLYVNSSEDFSVLANGGSAESLASPLYDIPVNEWVRVKMQVDYDNRAVRGMWDSISTTSPWTDWSYSGTTTLPSFYYFDSSAAGSFYWDDFGGASISSSNSGWLDKIYTLTPQSGTVLTQTPYQISFSYNVQSLSTYDTLGYDIYKSDGSYYASYSRAITATGTDTYSVIGNFEYGESYSWRPYLKLAATTTPRYCYGYYCNGAWHTFSLIDESTYYELNIQPNIGFYGATSTAVGDLGINFSTSSFFGGFTSTLSTKFPFAYMLDFVNGWFLLQSSLNDTPSDLAYEYNDGHSSGTITFISTASTSDFVYWGQQTRLWSSMVIWFLFGVWAFGFASRLL